MIPAWLRHARAGDIHRAVALRLCPRCRAPILTGLDADRAALTARCDPTPLTQFGEAIALITGRTTYDLMPDGDRKTLNPRNEDHIKRPRKYPVIAAHQCGASSLTPFAEPAPPKRNPNDDDDTPPF